jgi:hypothetical protein
VEILLLDTLLIGGAAVAVRWASKRPARFVPLLAATGSATAFVLVRNHYGLEDSAFLFVLALFCSIAAAVAAGVSIVLRRNIRSSPAYTVLAVMLVPLLFGAYVSLRLGSCLITGCELS